MFWIIFRLLFSKNKLFQRPKRSPEIEIHTVECEANDQEVEIEIGGDDEEIPQPAYFLISIWAYFELFLLVIVLFIKKEDEYPENILYGYCSHDRCNGMIQKALAYKVASCIFLIIGTTQVGNSTSSSTSLKRKLERKYFVIVKKKNHSQEITVFIIPWMVLNVFGIFPLWSVIVSAFCTCEFNSNFSNQSHFLHQFLFTFFLFKYFFLVEDLKTNMLLIYDKFL